MIYDIDFKRTQRGPVYKIHIRAEDFHTWVREQGVNVAAGDVSRGKQLSEYLGVIVVDWTMEES